MNPPAKTYVALYLLICLFILGMTSCKVIQPYQQAQGIANNGLYRDTTITDTNTIANIPWKQMFSDTYLQTLIQQGINNNLDLKIAVARIRAAEANYRQSIDAFFPSLTANANGALQNSPAQKGISSQNYETYLSSSWQVDIWGRLRSARRAQLAALLQSDAYRRAVQTQLVANIATNYYALLAYDQELKISLATVENRKEDVVTTAALKEADVLTGAAVVQSQANLYSVQVTIPDIKRNIRETENTISLLLGQNPQSIARDSLQDQNVTTDLRLGLPIQLLANRPDVQEAEYQLRYAAELTNVARTFFYPAITITGEGGLTSGSFAQFFNPSAFFGNIIGGLTQPVFQNGLNRQRLAVAKAQEEEYLYTFQRTLLTAGQEVSNALYSYQAATEKINLRSHEIYFLQKAVEFTRELMKYNAKTNYTDVLTSEQNFLAAQLNGINDKLQQLQAVVTLYNSLGGGWK